MVESSPFMGNEGTFVSGSKTTIVNLLDINHGSVTQINASPNKSNILNINMNIKKDTWINNTIPTHNATINIKGNLYIVVNTYKLNAVNLHSQKLVWSVEYSEIQDISDKGDIFIMGTEHLGCDLILFEPNLMKAVSVGKQNHKVLWEFKTKSAILGVYQVIRGTRIAKLNVKTEGAFQERLTKIMLYKFSSNSYFVTDRIKQNDETAPQITEYEKIIMPVFPLNQVLEINSNEQALKNKPAWYSTQTFLFGLLISGTLLIITLILLFKSNYFKNPVQKSLGHDIAIGDNTDYFNKSHSNPGSKYKDRLLVEDAIQNADNNKPLLKIEEEKINKPKSIHKKSISGSQVNVGHLTIYTNHILGYGSLGTIVYKGKFENRTVAVKRMLRPFHEVATKEISALIMSDNHPHVIRYFTKEEDKYF